MRVSQTNTPEEFNKITKIELYRLWWLKAMTDGQIAKMYGVSKQDVKNKRKEHNIKWMNSAILSIMGNDKYRRFKK